MDCSELNFVSSQALYGTMIAYPALPENEQIEKAIRMAKEIIKRNEPKKDYATFGRKSPEDIEREEPLLIGTSE